MKILNLGSGTKVSKEKEVINIDWSLYLRIKSNFFLRKASKFFLSPDRLAKLNSMGDNILVHNLAKGIPFEDESVDAVYHSHLFEHLDKEIGFKFLIEIHRVLKRGGVLRISVPDLEFLIREYLSHVELCVQNPTEIENHDRFIAPIIEQSIRREAAGASQQVGFIRYLDNFLLGDARSRGETHQWMYDRFNLEFALIQAGFTHVTVQNYNTSSIKDWNKYALDMDDSGNEYKLNSLYIEAIK